MELNAVKYPGFYVKKQTLLGIAGSVWIIAGGNVARLGIIAYLQIKPPLFLSLLLSLAVFAVFSFMFYKMSIKHSRRIHSYGEDRKPFWYFFDLKAYFIMAFMISAGIWLRSSGLAPLEFIGIFYTGLGLALFLAGIFFWRMYFKYPKMESGE